MAEHDPSASQSDEWVVVARFGLLHEADFARMKLDSEGIDSVIFDEAMSAMAPHFAIMMGGVRLMTRDRDAKRAIEILEQDDSIDSDFSERPISE